MESRKGLNKQQWVTKCTNRIAGALWLIILIGILTAAEPFVRVPSKTVLSLGMTAPEVITILLKQLEGSACHIFFSLIFAVLIMLPAVIGMSGRLSAIKVSLVLLVLDLILIITNEIIGHPDSEAAFKLIVIIIVKMIFIKIIFRGIRANGEKRRLVAEMKEADRQYEEELKTGIKYCENEDAEPDEGSSIEEVKNADSDIPIDDSETITAGTNDHSYCIYCGSKITEGNRFCEQCGKKVS